MRTASGRWFVLILAAGFGLISTVRLTAQTFTLLNGFVNATTNGIYPKGNLILSGGLLYGTTTQGGAFNAGTVFSVNTNGTGYTILYSFGNGGSDGSDPMAGLVLSGNTLYGTTYQGGASGVGTVFAINTDGSGYDILYSFAGGNDGSYPHGGLLLAGNTLYGMTLYGGSFRNGILFAINTDGSGYTNLLTFGSGNSGTSPLGGLIMVDDRLYGTTSTGGAGGNGVVFSIGTDGLGYTNLHNFAVGSDGYDPYATLVAAGNTLYGTTSYGGFSITNQGEIFAINTDGSGYTILHSFGSSNGDGKNPVCGLALSGSTLYGTAQNGGVEGDGTVFAIYTDGLGYVTLHNFQSGSRDGYLPMGTPVVSSNVLYGTTQNGGSTIGVGYGVAYSIVMPPPPNPPLLGCKMAGNGTNIIFTWTNTSPGFTLIATTNLAPPITWMSVSPLPVIVSGQYTVTNGLSYPALFYRLYH